MKIHIKRDLCIGAATCIALAPNTFALDDEDIAIVKDSDKDSRAAIIAAAKSCPTLAIELFEDDGTPIKLDDAVNEELKGLI